MKKYIIIALLGTIWGIIEMQLGTVLHSIKLPFTGAIMMSIGIVIITLARFSTGIRGSTLLLALVSGFVKFLFAGGLAIYTVLGIFIESIIIECIYRKDYPSRISYILAGSAAVGYSLLHPFFTQGLLAGWKILRVYTKIIDAGSKLIGLQDGLTLFLLLVLLHFVIGGLSGWLSYQFSVALQARGVLKKKLVTNQIDMELVE